MISTFSDINDLHNAARSGLTARLHDFHIIRNESVSDQMVKHMHAHRCDFHNICLDHESDYHLELDENTHKISSNNLYFIPKGTIINWQSDHVNVWKGYTIFAKPEFMALNSQRDFFRNGKPSVLSLSQEALHQLSAFCEQMLTEQESANDDIKAALQHWFSLFLLYCNRYYNLREEEEVPYEMEVKYKFQELLNFNIEQQRTVEFYADALHMTPRNFTRLIKKATGSSAKRMILEKMTEVAKERLKNSALSISEIAYGLSFKNTPQFNKHFKSITGSTPSAYRKGYQKMS